MPPVVQQPAISEVPWVTSGAPLFAAKAGEGSMWLLPPQYFGGFEAGHVPNASVAFAVSDFSPLFPVPFPLTRTLPTIGCRPADGDEQPKPKEASSMLVPMAMRPLLEDRRSSLPSPPFGCLMRVRTSIISNCLPVASWPSPSSGWGTTEWTCSPAPACTPRHWSTSCTERAFHRPCRQWSSSRPSPRFP